ncbi:MAG: von Willebrand factor type A domain-containing protein [Balneola sp.]|nr:von Willebrand factor type A domain-containing protein [Balneola sp.]MBO6652226.1 von Willebrand factor type A domain-containing protein [Balneola sp.]MBO6709953.1 von Willebrand factor type A domain-containing protein [Balneola sp.]MBO6798637.1 von Willebrand factor type A domain-containing protein [Balneola sp.]MBO6871892.1 von Willebrand factor type A domain-containing protein [Balneola sp.]
MKTVIVSLLLLILPEVIDNPNPLFLNDKVKVQGTVIESDTQQPLVGATIQIKAASIGETSDAKGSFEFYIEPGTYSIEVQLIGFKKYSSEITVPKTGLSNLVISLDPEMHSLDEIVMSGRAAMQKQSNVATSYTIIPPPAFRDYNTEEYAEISENTFKWATKTPLSTFSIDVDGASYSNVRRMLMDGRLPVKDAVRVEELINYFNYDYEHPVGEHPFSVNTEVGKAPWNPDHQLVQIGIQGEKVEADNLPPSNLVFLLDVSGSMSSHDKLPLLKKGFKLLTNQLREDDYVSIVVYAGNSGLVLPPTSGADKETILEALNKLNARGSTAGAAGIKQAYQVAKEHFRKDGNNRVILATDGDFNVGVSSNSELVDLIEEKRDEGIFLSVLGFGSGNLKDSKMEQIANNGNGNYYYIDNLLEAKKVLVSEMGGTLHTIAKDVKIQVEFNPQNVKAYRLIGYENRLLADEDFNNDEKDAGELGAGHTVTALYEVIPHGVDIDSSLSDIDPLKYQTPTTPVNGFNDELMTVKLRYKQPDGDKSQLLSQVIKRSDRSELSENLKFAASVASFGMLLRDSKFKGNSSFEMVQQLAKESKGIDENGYRAEFIKIVELAELLYKGEAKN